MVIRPIPWEIDYQMLFLERRCTRNRGMETPVTDEARGQDEVG